MEGMYPHLASPNVALTNACRSQLANLLKEYCLVEEGDSNVAQWLKDEGVNAPIGHVIKVRDSLMLAGMFPFRTILDADFDAVFL